MIKKRIIQLLEYKGIAKEEFYKKIGVTSANFRGKASETPINSTAIENILSEIPNLNLNWLITGIGEMMNMDIPNKSIPKESSINYKELWRSSEYTVSLQKEKIKGLENKLQDIRYIQSNPSLYSNVAEPTPELITKTNK